MLQPFRQPRWIIATVVVVALAGVFIRLGFWQLDRLDERRMLNSVGEERINSAPVDLGTLTGRGADLETIEYRRVTAIGEFDPSEEVLIRSQVELGQAGFHVITPLVLDDGSAVLVNRGWVPLSMDTPPVDAPPGPGAQRVEGWVHLTENRASFGPEDPTGELDVASRVDIARIGDQLPYRVAPVYLVATDRGGELPVPVDPPDFSNQGPHLGYAIQWFGFAVVGLVGLYFLLRRGQVQSR